MALVEMALPPTSTPVDFVSTTNVTGGYYPWTNKSDAQKVIEFIYLTILAATGTVGNLTVIFSIVFARRVHSNGNVFVINLAIADLLVTGFVVPTVIANVAFGGNSLNADACFAAGYIVTVTCTCSCCNLMFIAINRYYAVVRSSSYKHTFTKKKVYMMVVGIWIWSNLVSFPTFLGWSRIAYDVKMELCSWDDTYRYEYTIFLTTLAVFVPLVIIFFCYYKLFTTVRSSGRWVRSLSTLSGIPPHGDQKRRSMRKERNLLQTLATTVIFFCVCWLPYGITILVDAVNVDATAKKIVGWLGLTNSGVNFVIYGFMNPVFRKGYRDLYVWLFTCNSVSKTDSNMNPGSIHSDSMYRSGTRKRSSQSMGTPLSMPRNLNVITSNGSSNNLKQPYKTNSEIFTQNGTPQYTRRPVNGGLTIDAMKDSTDQENSVDNPVKLQPTISESVSAWRRPSTLFKKERKGSSTKKKNEKTKKNPENDESRQIRNSLMLLQIQLTDDLEPGSEPRRSKSENRNGTKYPEKKRSCSVDDTAMLKTAKKETNSSNDNDKTPNGSASTLTDVDSLSSNSANACDREVSDKLGLIRERSEADSVASAQNFSES